MTKNSYKRAGRKPRFNDSRRAIYLDALAQTGVIREAMRACGIASRATIKTARDSDEAFAQAEDEALETAADRIEAAMTLRGLYGQEVPVVDENGNAILDKETGEPRTVQVPPDNKMLLAMAKAVRPNRHATERRHLTSNHHSTVTYMPADVLEGEFERLLEEQRKKTDAILAKAHSEL
ncbi:MAG: hypothetical protein ABJH52_08555 [Henriciella sp.]